MTRTVRVQRAIEDTRRLIREIGAGLRDAVLMALPAVIRLGCIGGAVFAAAWAFEPIYLAFGGDWIAVIPATALILTPLAFVLSAGLSWGGLLLAGVVSMVMGAVLPALDPVALNLVVAGVLGAVTTHELTRKDDGHEQVEA